VSVEHVPPDPTSPRDENTPAIYGLFCGVISIPTVFLFGIGALFGVIAILLGRQGLERSKRGDGRRNLSILAIVLGAVSILLLLGWLIDLAVD
jgi:hypothetical protein